MKRLVLLFPLLALAGCQASSGWTEYRDTLRDAYGMAPYRNPVGGWGPGTLLRLGDRDDEAPSLRFNAEDVFSGPRAGVFAAQQPLGDTQASRITNIRFSASADGEDSDNILPADVSASLRFALTEDTQISWAATGAELHALKEGKVEIALGHLDPHDPVDKQFLDDLLDDRVILLSSALFVRSAEFTFDTDRELTAELRARIEQEATNLRAEVQFDRTDSRRFKLTTANPLYFAYTVYPIDREKLRARYREKQTIHLRAETLAEDRRTLEEEAAGLEAQLEQETSQLAALQDRVKSQEDPQDPTPGSDIELQLAKQELAELQRRKAANAQRLEAINQELATNQAASTVTAARIDALNSIAYDDEAPPAE